MAVQPNISGIENPTGLQKALTDAQYLADDALATATYLALALGKPMLLEGAPGVGKTEAAKALGGVLGRNVIRLQCFEGIDAAAALYEWNYPRQMLTIRQAGDDFVNLYSEDFLLERPLLEVLRNPAGSLLTLTRLIEQTMNLKPSYLNFCPISQSLFRKPEQCGRPKLRLSS